MSSKSHKDICTGGEKILCFIYFSNGPISEETLKQLQNSKKYVQDFKSDFVYKFSWIDSKKHPGWAKQMDANFGELRILRTGPKHRFIKFEYDSPTGENLAKMIEKIVGGDARSTILREGLPNFSEEL